MGREKGDRMELLPTSEWRCNIPARTINQLTPHRAFMTSVEDFMKLEDPGLNLTLKSTSRKSFAERHAEVAARPKAVVPPLEPLS